MRTAQLHQEGQKEKRRRQRAYLRKTDEHFPNLEELNVHKGHRKPNYLNAKKHALGHILLNCQKSTIKKELYRQPGEQRK